MTAELASFDELYRQADGNAAQVPIAVAGGADRTVLAALREAVDRRWIEAIVCGEETAMRQIADEHQVGVDGFRFLHADQAAEASVGAVREGRARLLMKGQISTPELMRAALDPDTGLRTGRVICQVPLIEIAPDGRRLLLADTGVTIEPTVEQKVDILRSAVELAHALGATEPRVALMAATEKVGPSMPETLDAAEITRRHLAGEITGCVVQGPLTFDLAYAAEAGDRKHIGGPVIGAANVMIFPSLLSANLSIKAIMYTAQCRFGGVLCGASCPVVFMSRADSIQTRLNSLALALALLRGV